LPNIGKDLRTGGLIRFRRLGVLLDHAPKLIQCGQRKIDQSRSDGQAPVAHFVECCLQVMGERGQFIESEHGPRTLDGVEGAENTANQLEVAAVFIQLQQSRFQLDKDFPCLFLEAPPELIDLAYC
jgi:hypothetical protein